MIDFTEFPTYLFSLELQADEDMILPRYKGSTFRGAFGISFRRTVCITNKTKCDNCILKSQCSYFRIFETESNETQLKILRNIKKVPHPFIIQPDDNVKTSYLRGDKMSVTLKIFGKDNVKYLPFYVFTFMQMGKTGIGSKRHKFTLLSVENVISDDERISLYNPNNANLTTAYKPLDFAKFFDPVKTKENVTLNFVTPFRIQNNNKILRNSNEITAEIIVRAVLRRYKMVAGLYFLKELDEEISKEIMNNLPELSENNLNYYHWERYSNRQKRKIEMSGFTGTVTLSGGSLDLLKPFLLLASYWNIGKNTVFGLGKYELI